MSDRPTPRTDWVNSTSAANLEDRYDRMHDLSEELERELAREKLIAKSNCEFAYDLASKLKASREENLALKIKIRNLQDVVTTDWESKEAFANRVRDIIFH